MSKMKSSCCFTRNFVSTATCVIKSVCSTGLSGEIFSQQNNSCTLRYCWHTALSISVPCVNTNFINGHQKASMKTQSVPSVDNHIHTHKKSCYFSFHRNNSFSSFILASIRFLNLHCQRLCSTYPVQQLLQ